MKWKQDAIVNKARDCLKDILSDENDFIGVTNLMQANSLFAIICYIKGKLLQIATQRHVFCPGFVYESHS